MLLCIFFCKYRTFVGSTNCFSVKVTGSQHRWNCTEGTNKVSWAHLQCQAGFCWSLQHLGVKDVSEPFSHQGWIQTGCFAWAQALHLQMAACSVTPRGCQGVPWGGRGTMGSDLLSALLLSCGTSSASSGTAPHPRHPSVSGTMSCPSLSHALG